MTADRVILHLHIPKTGGTTLNSCIYNHWHAAGEHAVAEDGYFHSGIYYFPIGFFKDPALSLPQRVRAALGRPDLRAAVGHFWFGVHEHVTRPWTYVTMLRNPLERVWSLYHHVYRRTPAVDPVDFMNNPPYTEVDNDQTRRISGLEPELGRCTRATLGRAKDNLRRHFAVVGVTERFDETLILLKRTFGWNGDLTYYPKNQNLRKPAAISMSPEAADSIRARNALDLELYDFAHELLDDAIASQGASFREEVARFEAWKQAWLEQLAAEWATAGAARPGAREAAGRDTGSGA